MGLTRVCWCAECGWKFGSPSAFDRHQIDDGSPNCCLPLDPEVPWRKGSRRPRLVWHPSRQMWVTKLDQRFSDGIPE